MMNILLDELPTEYKGYKINTDFRVGIRLISIFDDTDKTEEDKLDDAIDLLWGNGIPMTTSEDGIIIDYALIVETIKWFLSCGKPKEDNNNEEGISTKDIPYDFEIDAECILAAFMQQYRIDLSETKMHWFKFIALFSSLMGTVFNRIQEIRTQDPSDMPKGKARAEALRQKEQFRIIKVTPQRKAELQAVFGDEWEQHI